MRYFLVLLAVVSAGAQTATPATEMSVTGLQQVRRIYVGQLTGGAAADAMRELIISGLNETKLFLITDNPDRADAVLKGAADDRTFEDTFDSSSGISSHQSGGRSSSSGSGLGRSAGSIMGAGISDHESHHINERKHEAYASVRLCNRDGDVLWSTTQESLGAKFHGASADVATKVARQLSADLDRARRPASNGGPLR